MSPSTEGTTPHLDAKQKLGPYTLDQLIGRGGMGEVWLASRDGVEKPFVVKLLLPELAKEPKHQRRFLREAKLVAELPADRIVPVVDYGEDDGRLYLVMVFVDGVNLQTFCEALLAKGQRLPVTVVAYILAEILEALRDAHNHEREGKARVIVHRDVKPSNVLISSRGRVCLTDFGIAQYDSDFSLDTFGSLAYIAPEQARGESPPRPQSDIFGLGGIAHFLLTGTPPRRVNNAVELLHVLDAPPPATGRDDIPTVLENLRVSALEPSPDRRIGSARACLSLIEQWSGYRRSTTALEEYYRRLFGRPRTGMSEMFALARNDLGRDKTARVGPEPPDGDDDWQPWWDGDEPDNPPRPERPVARQVDASRHSLDLRGVPAEYLPQPNGRAEPDAPMVRRRPRRSPPAAEPGLPCVEATEQLPRGGLPRGVDLTDDKPGGTT